MKKERAKGGSVWGVFASIRLTIPLLIILAALSVIGTIIPQNAPEGEYLRRYSRDTYNILKGFGILDMYHSWWFIAVLSLLAVNLVACTAKRLPTVWQKARLARVWYGGVGTLITHIGVLVILIGALISAIWGFKGYVEIWEGEETDGFYLDNPRGVKRPFGFQVRCDAFDLELYPDGTPREYRSTLTITDAGRVVRERVPLRVNHPITYKGITLYQASYGVAPRLLLAVQGMGIRRLVQIGQGDVIPIAGTGDRLGLMQYRESEHGMALLLVLITEFGSPQGFWLYAQSSTTGPLRGEGKQGGYTFTIQGVKQQEYTGIQVAHDPGISVVWIGSTLLVVGMVVTFILRPPRKGGASKGDGR